jgi:8-oxo-dGTP pyrophosphatase MutT (NUDIX family)
VNEPAAKPPIRHDPALRALVAARLAAFDVRAHADSEAHGAAVALVIVDEAHGAGCDGLPAHAVPSDRAAVLLTRRAATLRNHAGQWAMPGGRVDPGESVEQAALRELVEEVGLVLTPADILGRLDDYSTRSGFRISPVVFWGPAGATLVPNPAEVKSVHPIPLDELLRADAPILNHIAGHAHPVLRMPVGTGWIAAPTAAVLYQFRELCLLGRPTRVDHFEQPHFARR